MIAEFDPKGNIFHIIFEPIPQETFDAFQENGRPFVHEVKANERDWTVTNSYVADGQILKRPTFGGINDTYNIMADDTDMVRFDGLPQPCYVRWNKVDYPLLDGVFEFTAAHPGEYKLKFFVFPYIDKHVVVNALAPPSDQSTP